MGTILVSDTNPDACTPDHDCDDHGPVGTGS
jgi:hypothetical protein